MIPQPSEEILHYITLDKENLLLPILLPNVRHFPMLEDDRFGQIVTEFLEIAGHRQHRSEGSLATATGKAAACRERIR